MVWGNLRDHHPWWWMGKENKWLLMMFFSSPPARWGLFDFLAWLSASSSSSSSPAPDRSGHRWTSTGTSRVQWAPLDPNRGPSKLVGIAGPQPPDGMLDRMPDRMQYVPRSKQMSELYTGNDPTLMVIPSSGNSNHYSCGMTWDDKPILCDILSGSQAWQWKNPVLITWFPLQTSKYHAFSHSWLYFPIGSPCLSHYCGHNMA